MSFLDTLIYGYRLVRNAGIDMPSRHALNFTNATIVDDQANGQTTITVGGVQPSRQVGSGAGLTGGGDLSADRTLNVGANADGSITVNADDIQVGVLATDAQHGARGGGTQHANATTSVAGFMSSADKTKLDNATSSSVTNTLVLRDGSGFSSHPNPTSNQHVATKAYVDSAINGLDWHASVRVATTANITLSGTQTIDGVALSVGDRVLVKSQTTGSENGLYAVASSTWFRTTDADVSAEVTAGLACFVSEGTSNGDTCWVLITNDPITLGSTSLTFVQFGTGTGFTTAGAGLTSAGAQVDVGAGTDIIVNANDVAVDSASAATASKIAKRGSSAECAFGYVTVGTSGTAPSAGLVRVQAASSGLTSIAAVSLSAADRNILNVDATNGFVGVGNTFLSTFIYGDNAELDVGAASVSIGAPDLGFFQGTSSPIISQYARTTNAATSTLTIRSQGPSATATGSNRNPGNLSLEVPAATSGGTEGQIIHKVASTTRLTVTSSGADVTGAATVSGSLSIGSTVAQSGETRVANNVTATGARNNAGSGDLALLGSDTSDNAIVGDTSNVANVLLKARSGGKTKVLVGSNTPFEFEENASVGIFTCNSGAGISISAPNGVQLKATGGSSFMNADMVQWLWRSTAGSERARFMHGVASTTDATPATLVTYDIPTGKTVVLRGSFTAYQTGGSSGSAGDACGHIVAGVFRNVGGTVTQVGSTTDTMAAQRTGLTTTNANFNISGTTVQFRGTGEANKNLDMSGWLEVMGRMS